MSPSRTPSGGPPPIEETIQARNAQPAEGLWVSVLGEGVAATVQLPKAGRLIIGRAPDAGLRVDHPSVSREHAALEITGHQVTLADLGSKNGTRLLGEMLAPRKAVDLSPGVLAEVGEVVLVLRPRPEPDGATSAPRPPTDGSGRFFGVAMRPVLALIDQVAADDIPVLLLGETGAGKEVLAERLHTKSNRATGQLLKLHCAALAGSLLESELFGHEKGAFTGAAATKPGLLETADGGTVFIDEVGELPIEVQVKLLRVLEDRQVTRVGALKPRSIDVRFVAATNRDLAQEITRGRFRQDLYYRLSGITVTIPPLRERKDEIAVLARRFLDQASAQRGRPTPVLAPDAVAKLVDHDWPGNVRELKNAMVRAVLVGGADGRIDADEIVFSPPPRSASLPAPPREQRPAAGLAPSRERDGSNPSTTGEDGGERARIVQALEQSAGNQKEAAKLLGISRRTLLYRLDEYGISRPRKRPGRE